MRRERTMTALARHFAGCAVLVGAAIAAACAEGDPAHPSLAAAIAPSHTVPTVAAGRRLRRLSKREYDAVVHDLLGDTTQPASQFGGEVYTNGFDNGSDGLTVQGPDVDAFQTAAESLAAAAVSGSLAPLIGTCDPNKDEARCVDAFLASFPRRAYRRPPTPGELQRLRAVYTDGAATGGFKGGIQLMLEAILQSPSFLYREELGAPDPSLTPGLVRLTDYEVASELSFLITGSMPDATLAAAADAGHLKTPLDLQRETARLLASPAAQANFRSFLHQWLGTDQLGSLSKDPTVYPAYGKDLAASMTGELDHYFDQVLWAGSGSLRELFTSNQAYVDPSLAALYGVNPPATYFQATSLDPKTRAGVMTRAGFLAAHADADNSGPVARGVFILGSILCAPPPPPPANVPPAPPASTVAKNHQTTRQSFDQHLSEPFCRSCHTVIDGIGFGFEEFDGLGAFRATENGNPIDMSGALAETDVDGPFRGASELAAKLVTSEDVLRCFVKQVYRFGMGDEETGGTQPLLTQMGTGFSADSRVPDLFSALVSDPAFVVRTTLKTDP
jgi:hypothetical protein